MIPNELRPLLERAIDVIEDGAHLKEHWDFAEELRAMLETPPADAADMGGQAGEEVEVVAWLSEVRSGEKTVIRASMSETSLEGMRKGYRDENAVIVRDDPCMTVAQHRRILAKHRQQAGKLVEALRKLTAAMACHDSTPEEYNALAGAREALADWEKTSCGK
nr:hypothetical protein [Pseudomonas sp. UBA6718]